ncbi:MAG: GntR family transcriptional regulator [Rhodospirillaceae bacterium]|nr:GntR family transcriptional regulator [Rhodospirillaceae bacterium]MDD9918536.1 GntR family transcriptional regulator [Rhodospirillaceae bacterium]MDD9925732.1 GntR family transcriptional regulator [Rhodospirillaceae bacterium]
MNKPQPRYLRISEELLSDIGAGKFPVGSMLPTELELCERFEVSRFTVREALRRLHEMGLLHRRRGSGTVVRSLEPQAAMVQALDSMSAMLQYPPETQIKVQKTESITASAKTANLLNCKAGRKWERISCLRWIDGTPIAWTDIYVLPRYKAVANSIGEGTKPVFQLLLDEFDETVANVRIEMFASSVTPEMAAALDVDVGASAMTIVRRYVGNRERTFEVSVSVHPEGRFTYAMDLEREWGVRG